MAPLSHRDITPTSTSATVYVRQDAASSTPSVAPANHKMSGITKVCISVIPAIVFLVGLYVLFLFWSRKRRARKHHVASSVPPPVPEKDVLFYNNSTADPKGSSKVSHMAAFSAPVHDGRTREAQHTALGGDLLFGAQDRQRGKFGATLVVPSEKDPRMAEADLDSPIDGSSPFRLKRGDTVKRNSLGVELARLWPSPPERAWTKVSSTNVSVLPSGADR